MADIIKTYRHPLPAVRFIGKKYGDGDRINGNFGVQWGEWFRQGWFAQLETLADPALKAQYEDADAYLGLMRYEEGAPFEYWIGMFLPADAPVPVGFAAMNFPACEAAMAWIRGREETGEIYGQEEGCMNRLIQDGIPVSPAKDGAFWCFERYVCPRFTTPDDEGRVILDIGFLQGL